MTRTRTIDLLRRSLLLGVPAALFLASPTLADENAVAEARAIVEAHLSAPEFWAPPAFDPTAAKGKTVWWVADQSSNIVEQWATGAKEAAGLVGLNINFFDAEATAADHARGFDLAIAANADAIVLGDGYAASDFAAQVAAAGRAGIPVFSLVSHPRIHDPSAPFTEGLVADISFSYPEAGKLLADWLVADSEGKGHVLVVDLLGIPSSSWQIKGFGDELTRLGADIQVTTVGVTQGANVQADVANAVSTAVLRDPSITHVIPPFDSLALFAQTGLAQLGPTAAHIKTAGFNAIIPQMQNLQTGGTPFKADLGGPNVWLSYAVVDNVLRVLSGQEPVHDYHLGFKIFTHENVQGLDVTREDDTEWYGVDYGALFHPVWQLK